MEQSKPFTRAFSALAYIILVYTSLTLTGLIATGVLSPSGSFFAGAAVTGNVTVCVANSKDLFDPNTCKNRLHTNIDVTHGLRHFHYVFRRKEDPSKGLYVIIQTSNTSVTYKLDYKITVPYSYKEHTVGKTYAEVGFNHEAACPSMYNPKCTSKDKYPPSIQKVPRMCCICGVNVTGETPRAKFNCDGNRDSIAISASCLEIEGPWYNLYKPVYPPEMMRNAIVMIYKFDSSSGVIPNLDLDTKGKYDNYDYDAGKKLDPKLIKAEERKELTKTESRLTEAPSKAKSVEKAKNPNFRKIMIDMSLKEEHIDDLDINVTLLSSNTKNGSPAPMFDKYVAIPSFPRTNETVKGSSLKDKCVDATRPKSLKCPEYMSKVACNAWPCTLNMRTIEEDAVDITGLRCDTIGFSVQGYVDHRRVCNSLNGSCIKRQLKWYLEQEGNKDKTHLPKFYGVEPSLTIKRVGDKSLDDKDEKKTTWQDPNRIHFLNYIHSEDDVSRLKIDTFEATVTEIVSDFPGFIVSSKVDKECKLNTQETCNIQVLVKNMGVKRSDFTVRTKCYDGLGTDESNVVGEANETTLDIEANGSKLFNIPIRLSGNVSLDSSKCKVLLFSGIKKLLDNTETPIKIVDVKPSIGLDPKFLDPDTFGEAVNVMPVAPVRKDEGKVVSQDTKDSSDEPQCTCYSWNIFCMIIHFKTCILAKVQKVYMYILIALGILLFLIMLPVLIPLFGYLGRGFIKLCKMPHEIMERRRIERMSRVVTNINPEDLEKKGSLGSTMVTNRHHSYEVNPVIIEGH